MEYVSSHLAKFITQASSITLTLFSSGNCVAQVALLKKATLELKKISSSDHDFDKCFINPPAPLDSSRAQKLKPLETEGRES